MRVDAISRFSVQGAESIAGIKYPYDTDANAPEGRFQTANALNGTSGQFGITDVAQFLQSGDALTAGSKNPASSAGLPFVQRPELLQPGGDLRLQQQALDYLRQ